MSDAHTPNEFPPPPPPVPFSDPQSTMPGYSYDASSPGRDFPGNAHTGPIPTQQIPPQPNAPQYQLGVDNTGVPASPLGPVTQVGTTFLKSLLDLSFRTFITRRAASVIYTIGLLVIVIGAVIALLGGLVGAFAAMENSYTFGAGVFMLFSSLIGVPLGALVMVIVLRLGVESGVALVAVAENTEQIASNTQPKPQRQ